MFKAIYQQDNKLAKECYLYAENLLIQKGEYELLLNCTGDLQMRFDSYRRGLEVQRESQHAGRSEETIPDAGATSSRRRLRSSGHGADGNQRFVGQVQAGQSWWPPGTRPDAEKIRDEAVAVLDDARLKSAVSDAEEKIQKRPTLTPSLKRKMRFQPRKNGWRSLTAEMIPKVGNKLRRSFKAQRRNRVL